MVVRTQPHLRIRRQGPARCDGTAVDQPSAGLPDATKAVNAHAKPGTLQRPHGFSLHRGQTYRQTGSTSRAGAADRELHPVRPLHPVLRPDVGGPFIDMQERSVRSRSVSTPMNRSSRTLRQHGADPPGGGANGDRLLPFRARVRSICLQPQRSRALRVGGHDHRRGKCCGGWPVTTRKSTSGTATRAGGALTRPSRT